MKRSISLLLCFLGSANVLAESPRFVNADGSELSELCVAATQSRRELSLAKEELGLSKFDLSELACNGIPWQKFARENNNFEFSRPSIKVFTKNDSTRETEICYAAVTSESLYNDLLEEYRSDSGARGKSIKCNNMSLKKFVARYKNSNLVLSLN